MNIMQAQIDKCKEVVASFLACMTLEKGNELNVTVFIKEKCLQIVNKIDNLQDSCSIVSLGFLCFGHTLLALIFVAQINITIMHSLFWANLRLIPECKQKSAMDVFCNTLQFSVDVGMCLYSSSKILTN